MERRRFVEKGEEASTIHSKNSQNCIIGNVAEDPYRITQQHVSPYYVPDLDSNAPAKTLLNISFHSSSSGGDDGGWCRSV
jgi:hypothetical protein